MTIAASLGAFTARLEIDAIPRDVQNRASMLLADTLACAVAATAEPGPNAIDIVIEQARTEQAASAATVIGTEWKTSVRAAALANCTMARFLDANDIYMPAGGSLSGSGHFSDALPALLAAAEACASTGRELIEAIVIAYEIQAALADSFPWLDRGFHSVSQVTVAVALGAGMLMGLSERELAHAASLAITSGLFVQSWLHPSTDVPAIKGGAPGLAAERGITCAELAGRGFTGPLDAFETFFAFFSDSLPDPRPYFDRLGTEWMTPRNAIKSVRAQIYIQPVAQSVGIIYDAGLRLDRLKLLRVISNDGACGRVQGTFGAFRPASREAADHSTPFVAVMTLRDGRVSPASYHGEPWTRTEILDAMARVDLVIDDKWTSKLNAQGWLGAEVEAEDVDGRRFAARIEQFLGHPDNPLSRDQFVEKLESLIGRPEVCGSGAGARLLGQCQSLAFEPTVERLLECCSLTPASDGRRPG